jgi:hypothetical protein
VVLDVASAGSPDKKNRTTAKQTAANGEKSPE